MQPTIFISLDAILPGHQEAAFRSLLALHLYGIAPANQGGEAVTTPATSDILNSITSDHGAKFVITSLHVPGLDKAVLRPHLRRFGLTAIAENLAHPWATEPAQASGRAGGILEWILRHSSVDFPYLVIDTHQYASELTESPLAQNTIILGNQQSANQSMIYTVREILHRQQYRNQDA
jgi:hypothetical protein